MGTRSRVLGLLVAGSTLGLATLSLAEPPEPDRSAVESGKIQMTAGHFLHPTWKDETYRKLGPCMGPDAPDPEKDPAGYAAAFNARYGFHPAPFPNDGLPMGLRRGVLRDGTRSGLIVDCMMCHGGSIGGTSYVGLGNTQLDLSLFFEDMARAR